MKIKSLMVSLCALVLCSCSSNPKNDNQKYLTSYEESGLTTVFIYAEQDSDQCLEQDSFISFWYGKYAGHSWDDWFSDYPRHWYRPLGVKINDISIGNIYFNIGTSIALKPGRYYLDYDEQVFRRPKIDENGRIAYPNASNLMIPVASGIIFEIQPGVPYVTLQLSLQGRWKCFGATKIVDAQPSDIDKIIDNSMVKVSPLDDKGIQKSSKQIKEAKKKVALENRGEIALTEHADRMNAKDRSRLFGNILGGLASGLNPGVSSFRQAQQEIQQINEDYVVISPSSKYKNFRSNESASGNGSLSLGVMNDSESTNHTDKLDDCDRQRQEAIAAAASGPRSDGVSRAACM